MFGNDVRSDRIESTVAVHAASAPMFMELISRFICANMFATICRCSGITVGMLSAGIELMRCM